MDTGTIIVIVVIVALVWYTLKKKKNKQPEEDHRAEIAEEVELEKEIEKKE